MNINSKHNQFQNRHNSHAPSPYHKHFSAHKLSNYPKLTQSLHGNFPHSKINSSNSLHLVNNVHKPYFQSHQAQKIILDAKCRIVTIQGEIQLLLQYKQTDLNDNNHQVSQTLIEEISHQFTDLISIVMKVPTPQRSYLIVQILSLLNKMQFCQFLTQLPFDQISTTICFISKLFQNHLHQNIHPIQSGKNQNKNLETQNFSRTKYFIQMHNPDKPEKQIVEQSLSKSGRINCEQIKNPIKFNSSKSLKKHTHQIFKDDPLQNPSKSKKHQAKVKQFKDLVQFIALNRVDSILAFLFQNQHVKQKLLTSGNKILSKIQTILLALKSPTIQKRLKLLYTEEEFQTHLFNIAKIDIELQNYFEGKNILTHEQKIQEESQNLNQIQALQKDIRILLAEELQNRAKQQQQFQTDHARTCSQLSKRSHYSFDKINNSNNFNFTISRSLPKKFIQSSSNTFRFTSKGNFLQENSQSQTHRMGYLTNQNTKLKLSINGSKGNIETKKNEFIYLNDKCQTNSDSKFTSNSKLKNGLVQSSQKAELFSQVKLQKADSKGMNYNKIVPLRNSILAGRSSILTNYGKNGMLNVNNNNIANFDSFSSAPNQSQQQGSKKSFGIKISNPLGSNFCNKPGKGIQRRSGFVGLNKKKQPSTKRISTRWNYAKQGNFANLFSESSFKKLQEGTIAKKNMKSNFSMSKDRKQKMNVLDEKEDSSSSISKSDESNLERKASNESSISFIGQTYNFLSGDKFSVPKLGSKQSSLVLQNQKIAIIDEKFQEMRHKLFYIRLMTLLSEVLKIVTAEIYAKQSSNRNKKYVIRVETHHEFRKKTFYQEKYRQQSQQKSTNDMKLFRQYSRQLEHGQKGQQNEMSSIQKIYEGLQRLNKQQRIQFSKVQNKLKETMEKYLRKKDIKFQQKLKKYIKSIEHSQLSTTLLSKKVLQIQDQLIIKPFYLFLDIQDHESNSNHLNSLKKSRLSKVMLMVSGSSRLEMRKSQNGQSVQECSEISLKYKDEVANQGKISFPYEKKSASVAKNSESRPSNIQKIKTLQNGDQQEIRYQTDDGKQKNITKGALKKTISIFEQEQDNNIPLKIMQFPLSIIIKKLELEEKIVYKKIEICLRVFVDQAHEHRKKSRGKQRKLYDLSRGISVKKTTSLNNQEQQEAQGKNQCSNQSSSVRQGSLTGKQSFSFESHSLNSSQDASDQCSEQSQSSSDSGCQSSSSSSTISQNDSEGQNSSPSQNKSQSSSSSSQKFQRRPNRILSIDSSTIEHINQQDGIQLTDPNQQLSNGKVKGIQKKPKILNYKKRDVSKQSFYNGYFSLEKIIEQIIKKHLKLTKTEMGTKVSAISTKNTSKTSFQSTVKHKIQPCITKKLKISKISPTFKTLVESLPKDLNQLQEILLKNALPAKNKKRISKSDFINFTLEIKVNDQTTFEKMSQKNLIRQKYNNETSKKSFFKLDENIFTVVKTYEKVNLIRKINTYFFFKNILLIINKIDQSGVEIFNTILNEEIYCDNFHELYERQIFQFSQINALSKEQSKNNPKNSKHMSFLFEKKFKNIFLTEKLKTLKKFNQSPKVPFVSKEPKLNQKYKKSSQSNQNQELDFSSSQKHLFFISVEQIPQSSSKTQNRFVNFVQYYSDKQLAPYVSLIIGNQLQFASKEKPVFVQNISEQRNSKTNMQNKDEDLTKNECLIDDKNGKIDLTQSRTKNLNIFTIQNDQEQKIRKKYQNLYDPHKQNMQKRKIKRTTIQINKIQDFSQFSSEVHDLQSNQQTSLSGKSKSNFVSSNSLVKFPTLAHDICSQYTHKNISQQTQKSLKSHQSKTRLHRHGYHISSLLPTSVKNAKSHRHLIQNFKDPNKKRIHCPSLTPSLNSYQQLKSRKKYKKSYFTSRDNFVDFKLSKRQEKHQEDMIKTKSKSNFTIQNFQIQMIKKSDFYKKSIKSFKTIIKRAKKFIVCFVQWWFVNEFEVELQVFTGIYATNLSTLKIISGKIQQRLFKQIIKSHTLFQNYVNCEIDTSLEINSGPIKDCLTQKQKMKADFLYDGTNSIDDSKIRPILRIQKLLKVRLIARFIKKFRICVSSRNSESKTSQNHYAIISIFLYDSMPNQDVYVHIYTPKNSKNFVFTVQGSVFYRYLTAWTEQYSKDKNTNDSIKNSSVEKESSKQLIQEAKRRKPRLSIFSPLSQVSNRQEKQEQDLPGINLKPLQNQFSSQIFPGQQLLKSTNTVLSLKKKSESVQSSEKEQSSREKLEDRKKYKQKVDMNWKQMVDQILKIRKKIKFQQLLQIYSQKDCYFVQFFPKKSVKFQVIQILAQRVHVSIEQKTNAKNNQTSLKIHPNSIEIVSVEYEDKKFSLLNSFSPDAFSRIKIKQTFTKYSQKLENSHHFFYNFQNLLSKASNHKQEKVSRKSVTKSLLNKESVRDSDSVNIKITSSQKGQILPSNANIQKKQSNSKTLQKQSLQTLKAQKIITETDLNGSKVSKKGQNQELFLSRNQKKHKNPQLSTNILYTMVNAQMINSFIKKFNPTIKFKSILYSEILFEFKKKCEYNSFQKFQRKQRLQKQNTIFINENKFCLNRQKLNQTFSNKFYNNHEDNHFYSSQNFMKLKFKRVQKQNDEIQSIDESDYETNNRIEISIDNLFGQNLYRLEAEKIQELFPFATNFSNAQMKKFLKRIIKDQKTVEYLRVKNPKSTQIFQNDLFE